MIPEYINIKCSVEALFCVVGGEASSLMKIRSVGTRFAVILRFSSFSALTITANISLAVSLTYGVEPVIQPL